MNKLTEALQTQNIRGVKSAILAYLSADPLDRSGEIKRAIATIDGMNIAVWQKNDGTTALVEDKALWTKEYFAELQAHLVTNFSKECVEHVLKVGKHAYKEELNRPKEPVRPNRPAGNASQRGAQDNTGKFVMAGVAVVAAGIALYLITK